MSEQEGVSVISLEGPTADQTSPFQPLADAARTLVRFSTLEQQTQTEQPTNLRKGHELEDLFSILFGVDLSQNPELRRQVMKIFSHLVAEKRPDILLLAAESEKKTIKKPIIKPEGDNLTDDELKKHFKSIFSSKPIQIKPKICPDEYAIFKNTPISVGIIEENGRFFCDGTSRVLILENKGEIYLDEQSIANIQINHYLINAAKNVIASVSENNGNITANQSAVVSVQKNNNKVYFNEQSTGYISENQGQITLFGKDSLVFISQSPSRKIIHRNGSSPSQIFMIGDVPDDITFHDDYVMSIKKVTVNLPFYLLLII
ncbi:MAG: hypothetical protein QHH09_02630 [Microgenomates group bacterium]|nr:hypothetical protein [Microgenomates group bacterium]